MKLVVQRSLAASVIIDEKMAGKITHGMVVFVCFEKGDERQLITKAASKIVNLRIFEDPETGRMSKNINQVKGQILLISQFTLSWNGMGGNRPSFDLSMEPVQARDFYDLLCRELGTQVPLEMGEFAAHMKISLINDGPVTFSLQI